MYTAKDVKELFIKRNEFIADLGICEALHQRNGKHDDNHLTDHIELLRCYISMIDSLFSILNYTELFVIRSRLIEGLDWPQIAIRYQKIWGEEDGRTVRSFQCKLRSGIAKVNRAMNGRPQIPWRDILETKSPWS